MEKDPLKTISSILSTNDIERNGGQGWCMRASGRSRRYVLAEPKSRTVTLDFSRAAATSHVISFFSPFGTGEHIIFDTTTGNGIDRYLPDYFGIQIPYREDDDFLLACSLSVLPHRFAACVITEELNAANLDEVLMDAAMRTRCAHERYLAAWRVSSNTDDDMNKIIDMSRILGIGVIQICQGGIVYPRTYQNMTPEPTPDLQNLSALARLSPSMREFLATNSALIYGELFSGLIHRNSPKAP